MNKISNITIEPCSDSNFVKLQRMRYEQNGVKKAWDLAEVHDSVAILIYHTSRDAFVLVKQFRPPVFLKNEEGMTYELCAGIVDKDLTLAQIAQEEIEEETGYRVDVSRLKRVTSFYTAVGFAGASQTLYYVEVDDEDKVSDGGGVDVEEIEVVYLPAAEAMEFVFDESKAKTPGIMFALSWWNAQR